MAIRKVTDCQGPTLTIRKVTEFLNFYRLPPNAANRVNTLEGSHIRYDNVTVHDI